MENLIEQKRVVLDFMKSQKLAALATADERGKPEVAMVDFSETGDLEVVVTTLIIYRKYRNLSQNKNVALAIGGADNITVQYEGAATELSREEFKKFAAYHIAKNPIEEKFAAMPEARFFKISPTWIRYSNYAAKPNEIFEIKF